MVLPPEQFHIKRRREEEPVETLYIQSELHQKKRRFTDFIFQRVQLGGGTKGNNNNNVADADTAGAAPTSTASTPGQGRVRSPRSVSTSFFPKRASGSASVPSPSPAAAGRRVNAGGVPVIRATSPGAEFREERALAAARRKQEEAKQERVKESVQLVQQSVAAAAAGEQESEGDETKTTAATTSSSTTTTTTTTKTTTPSFPTSIRRFHISRPNTPTSPLKTAAGSGVAKSSTPTRTRAVLVEKLTQTPSLRGASILETLERAEKNQTGKEIDTVIQSQLVREEDRRPQKRPVVNQAEKKWREQQKDSISAAKEHLATKESQDDDYLDRLARDLELVMLDIESEESHMDGVSLDGPSKPVTTTTQATPVKPNRTPLKYMPRHPTPRKPADTTKEPDSTTTTTTTKERKDEDMDEGYVYDTYIRIPVPRSTDGLTDPLSDTSTPTPSTPHDIDPTRKDIGLVVITEEDEDLWENFLENDDSAEENWDGEDVDSNAEDNPANDYPDEDLSSADENDDPTAVYRRYRHAGSDDEEFDVNYYDENDDDDNDNDSEGEIRNRRYDNDEDEDDKTLGRARRLQNFYRQQDAQRVGKVSDDEDDDDMF
ncbi:uncharacterized protein TRUGW13939_06302 [Talaromyces rugulosus]|uniref:Transcription factor Iwr1 domain-containing protein n=1 Tax=Talaromyces rugulosus TaxID=121627 RepID=A0A7H8QYH8_TALRU|nr:uncharacterized protein TRUGW13939_06302 [Talaromyces rugulosus]QKX59170.1 hypothetical protein TRUGW13939_06302 [Talaromyces rugulosus]